MKTSKTLYHVIVLCGTRKENAKLLPSWLTPRSYIKILIVEVKKPWNWMILNIYDASEPLLFNKLEEMIVVLNIRKFPHKLKDKLPGRILSRRYNVFLFGTECYPDVADIKLRYAKYRRNRKW